jgi:hypothetical protein
VVKIVLIIRVKCAVAFCGVVLTNHMEYEIEGAETVSTAVVRAVSAVDGRKPCALPPLTAVLDPDALDAIFDSQYTGEPRTGGHLSFIYSGYSVTVDNGEYLTVEPLDNRPQATSGRKPGSADL